MNRKETARALDELSASPASKWIGNKLVGGMWLQKCMRCGAEETLVLPSGVRGPEDVPAGFDEKLFDWKRSFQIAHEGCVETSGFAVDARPTGPCSAVPDVTMQRILHCAKHGLRRWRGHIMCDACGRTYQTGDARESKYAPEICRCGRRLLPPAADRVGDILGLRTGGVVIDEHGRRYQTPEAQDWTARSICYLCFRYFAKRHGGRVPVEGARN